MQYNKSQVGRAAAILTTSEVAGSALKLERSHASQVTVDFSLTIGSLTSATLKFYVSMDNSTYDLLTAPDGSDMSLSLTANTSRCYTLPSLAGWKYFRCSLQGVGTATGSTSNYTYRYLARGSQR